MRAKYGHAIDIDTCAAAFAFDDKHSFPYLGMYSLIVVDEISQLQGYQYERIGQLWQQADKAVCVIVLGDKWQIAGFGNERPWHTGMWKLQTFKIEFHKPWRCQDEDLQRVLDALRTAKPNDELLAFLKSKQAWAPPGQPTPQGIGKLFRAWPKVVIMTCTRRGSMKVNDCALQAFYPRYEPRAVLPGDVESNPDNYHRDGTLKAHRSLKQLEFPVFVGMRTMFTRNVRKDIDYVNGMMGTLEAYESATGRLRILTDTGFHVEVTPWTDRELGGLVYYPIKPGYSSTILKLQGSEQSKIVAFLDAPNVPGAAYTALSRISYMADFLIGGIITADHFCPVR